MIYSSGKKTDTHPLPINIIKLQRFDYNKINIQDIIFLNWLIVNASYFNFKEFYKSEVYIFNSIGLKRTTLNTCRKKFIKMGFVEIIVKGMPAIHYYKFNTEMFLNSLDKILKSEEVENQKELYKIFFRKKRTDYNLTQKKQKELKTLAIDLKEIYLNILQQRKCKSKCKTYINDNVLKNLNAVCYDYSIEEIKKSFINYVHSIINKKIEPKYLFNYFLSINDYTGKYTTIEYNLKIEQKRY